MSIGREVKIEPGGELEIVIRRAFAAPPSLLFRAHTEPDFLKRWLGVRRGWEMTLCEVDLQVGGRYRYMWRNEAKRMEMGYGGAYREIVRPERLVCTERFEKPPQEGESLVKTEFAEDGAGTVMTMTIEADSTPTRDAILRSGMEAGIAESYLQLEAVLLETNH